MKELSQTRNSRNRRDSLGSPPVDVAPSPQSHQWIRQRPAMFGFRRITNENRMCSFLNRNSWREIFFTIMSRWLRADGDSSMSMFIDIFAALLALGAAAVWILTARGELPPDWDHLGTLGHRSAEH